MASNFVCQLIPFEISSSEPNSSSTGAVQADNKNIIELKDKERITLGKVSHNTCSCTEHVQLIADLTVKELSVTLLCPHYTCQAGTSLLVKIGESCILGPGAQLTLQNSNTFYNVFFGVPPPLPLPSQTPLNPLSLPSSLSPPSSSCHWYTLDNTLLVMEYGTQKGSSLVAAFDMDGTLIKTISSRLPFRTTPDDWTFWDPSVPHKLKSTSLAGYRIVIFTNQGGILYGNPPQEEFKIKVESIMASLGQCSVLLIAAIGDDENRKPRPGMWSYFVNEKNFSQVVNLSESFYVGDAAGRPAGGGEGKRGAKKDFSCCDRKFASNIHLPFYLPEEYFLGEPPCPNYSWDSFNPHTYPCDLLPTLDPKGSQITSDKQELLIFVGYPASGKTHFYKTHMKKHSYFRVNRDELGSWQKCVTNCERALEIGKSVVVDNTNPDIESRYRYIQIATRKGLPIRCFWFMTSLPHALHNNCFREVLAEKNNQEDYVKVPHSAFKHYQSKFVQPCLSEGFKEIIKVTINLNFTDKKVKELYMQFWD